MSARDRILKEVLRHPDAEVVLPAVDALGLYAAAALTLEGMREAIDETDDAAPHMKVGVLMLADSLRTTREALLSAIFETEADADEFLRRLNKVDPQA